MAKITPKIARIRRAQKLGATAAARREADGKDAQIQYGVIQQQVEQEFQLCFTFALPKTTEMNRRLKLYNNQAREKTKVGYPLVYSVHQQIHANLFGDKLQQVFKPRQEGDSDQSENLISLSEYDVTEMRKDEHDEAWNFDAELFGRGLSLFNNFDVDTKTPIPTVIDPTIFLRDPMAMSVNGDREGNGAARFMGYEVNLTRATMEKNPSYFNLAKLRYGNDELTSLTAQNRRMRQQAQGHPSLTDWENLTTNYSYAILRWFTHIDGKKYVVELANNRRTIVRLQELPWDYWPIIDRPFSPIAHDWDGVSIMDLLEDKQRYGANMMNVAGDIVKADLNGMWIYRGQGFRKNQDFNFKFGKWIEYNGEKALADAAAPLQMKQVSQGVQYVMNWLDITSQVAAATPSLNQPALQPGQQNGPANASPQTLGQDQMLAQTTTNRYSLTARIYGWSEKRFWYQWYRIYEEYFTDKGFGKKIARLEGAFGTKWAGKDGMGLTSADILCGNSLGPDIQIESKVINEATKARQLNQAQVLAPLVLQDPNADQMYFKRKMLKLIWPKDEVERMLPVTQDEYEARNENDKLNDEEYVPVKTTQNHVVHLREHAQAKDNKFTEAHIKAHQFMLMVKRQSAGQFPQLFPQMPEEQQAQAQQQKPNAQGQQSSAPQAPANANSSPMK